MQLQNEKSMDECMENPININSKLFIMAFLAIHNKIEDNKNIKFSQNFRTSQECFLPFLWNTINIKPSEMFCCRMP